MTGYNDNEHIEIACTIRHETDRAYLVYDGKVTEWVPKSMVSDFGEDDNGKITSIFVPEWLAEEKGFV